MRTASRIVIVLALSCTGCGAGFLADASTEAGPEEERHPIVNRWERESTVRATCPPAGAKRDGGPCGLLSDALSPEQVTAALPQRYPHASIAELSRTCGLDPSCESRAREMVWLESHNRNVARVAQERRLDEDDRRRQRLRDTERVVAVLAISGAVLALCLGASFSFR